MKQTGFYRRHLRGGRAVALLVLAIGLIGWGAYATVSEFRPKQNATVRLAVGSTLTRRFQIANFLADESRGCGVDMQVVSTPNIREALKKATDGQLDMGLASAGLDAPECKILRVLAGLDVEPLHILVRRELAGADVSLREAVRGRRVCLGAADTVDRLVGSDVLSFLGLTAKDKSGAGDYFDASLTKEELCRLADEIQSAKGAARDAKARELPDVITLFATLPSRVAQKLLDTGEYTLAPFPYAEHYLASELEHKEQSDIGVDRLGIQRARIPAAMYIGESPIPAGEIQTIGLRTLLVARSNLPSETVNRVMQSVFETDFNARIHPQSPREISTDFPIHPGALAYLDRNKPLLTGPFFERVSTGLSLFGAFSAGALSLYGYLRRRRIRSPGEYLKEIRRIDAVAMGQQVDSDAPSSPDELAVYLQAKLVKLKEQLIQDYCDNRVQSDTTLMSILTMFADSRSQLVRSAAQPGASEPIKLQCAPNERDSIAASSRLAA